MMEEYGLSREEMVEEAARGFILETLERGVKENISPEMVSAIAELIKVIYDPNRPLL